jgi:hypothetical protein
VSLSNCEFCSPAAFKAPSRVLKKSLLYLA